MTNSKRLAELVESMDDATLEQFVDEVFRHPGTVKEKYGYDGCPLMQELSDATKAVSELSLTQDRRKATALNDCRSEIEGCMARLKSSEFCMHYFADVNSIHNVIEQASSILQTTDAYALGHTTCAAYTGDLQGAKDVLRVYALFFKYLEKLNGFLAPIYGKEWKDHLLKSTKGGDEHFLVCFAQEDSVVSNVENTLYECALVSKDNCQLYEKYGQGVLFIPNSSDFVCMTPNRDNCMLSMHAGQGDMAEIVALMGNGIRIGNSYIVGSSSELRRLYSLKDFVQACQSDKQNMVLLNKRSKGSIFVFQSEFSEHQSNIIQNAAHVGGSIITYDCKSNKSSAYADDDVKGIANI